MPSLSDPLKINGVTLRNRIVMPPMNTELATEKGSVTARLIDHYVKHSRQLGLVIVEHSYVSQEGKLSKKQLGIHDDRLVGGLKKLVEAIHETGTPVLIQINHAGRRCTAEITGTQAVAPSRTKDARALKITEIEALAETFAAAAKRAYKAGFDGVEIHGAHGFLLNQFYSPLTNKRKDDYGRTLNNRMRFPLEVVERVKEEVKGKLLFYRLGADDLDPEGTRISDSKKFAVKLEEAGVDAIDVSGGICGSRPEKLQGKQGYFIPQAQKIKAVVQVPVIGVGGITKATYADSIVRHGKVDLVGVCRGLVKNPNWAAEAMGILRKK